MKQLSLLIVMLAALMIPLLMAQFNITRIPTAVAEIVVGILLGKSLLNMVQVTANLTMLSSLGVIVLIFLSGMEIDFDLFKPQPKNNGPSWTPVKMASWAFAGVVITAGLLGWLLHLTGFFNDYLLATIIFSTIALGIVIAALKEKDLLSKPLGQTILLTAVLGEVVPMLALTVYAALNGGHAGRIWLVLLIFLAAIVLLLRFRGIYQFFERIDKATTQLDIRLAFFLIFTLVTIAERVGAENILGAFLAGMVMKLLRPSEATQDKLTSLGYGFLIPIFFIMTGAKLDLRSLLADRQAVMLIPVFFICFMLAKLIPFFIFKKRFTNQNALAGSFLVSTTITLVLPTLQVARNLNAITSQQSGAFTLAAVLTCVLSPILFNQFYYPEKEDLVKTKVTFVGTNLLTIPVAQQLSKGWYNIRMVTNRPKNYGTYNSEVENIQLLSDLDEATLTAQGIFDTDILVLGYADPELNFTMAQQAVQHQVPRIVARFESHDLAEDRYEVLAQQGVEIFNTYNVNISLLRGMIESPSSLKILTDTEAGLYEVTVHNRRFTGIPLRQLPFIDLITVSRIYRNGKYVPPHGNTMIEPEDHLVFTGDKDTVSGVRQQLSRQN